MTTPLLPLFTLQEPATWPAWQSAHVQCIAQAPTLEALEALRLDVLGRSGSLTLAKRGLKDVPAEERPAVGQGLNALSQAIEAALEARKATLEAEALATQLQAEQLDITLPGAPLPRGGSHPLARMMDDIAHIFEGMGYQVLEDNACPEVETDYYNFEALNFAEDHPARDMQDTYYTTVAPQVLLRSQTSNAQIRTMQQQQPPLQVLSLGRVYRNEEVSSRKFVLFHQVEGLYVAQGVRLSDLKGTLQAFINQLFGGQRTTRFRPSYFPFTEPSVEVDVQCLFCQGHGCKVCSHSGWLEVLGAGMVHPNVLQGCGIDPDVYSGFAFGLGVERLAMLRDGIEDIRLFYQNNLSFLRGLAVS